MMKAYKLLIAAIILSISSVFGQPNTELPHYSAQQLRNDIDTLVSNIEEIHINPYYKYPKEKFYTDIQKIKESMTQPMTQSEFFCLLAPIISKLEDGHTSLHIPYQNFKDSNPILFPYNLKLSLNKPFITTKKSMQNKLQEGTEILSINGLDSKSIVDKLLVICPGESKKFRLVYAEHFLNFYLQEYLKLKSPYKVIYGSTPSSAKQVTVIEGITLNSLNKVLNNNSTDISDNKPIRYTLKIDKPTNIATINFRSFSDLENFKTFMDSSFKVIHENKIENLIIDITKNGGGNSEIGDEFFQYISPVPFDMYDKVLQKINRFHKAEIETYYDKNKDDTAAFNAFMSIPNGTIKTYSDTTTTALRENPLRFHGKIYLLTSTYTFSSAADFATAFKHYKMGTIVGEETGGWMVCYGDVLSSDLPNSKLNFGCSYKLFYNIGAKDDDFHGVIPDIEVSADKAMEYTIDLITQKNR